MTGNLLLTTLRYFDGNHTLVDHTLKVLGYARSIAAGEKISGDELTVTELSAVLHDVGIPESLRLHNSAAPEYQEKYGPEIGEKLLADERCPKNITDRVLFNIAHHHSYDKADGSSALQILFEADFIVNLIEGHFPSLTPANVMKDYFKTATGKEIMRAYFDI